MAGAGAARYGGPAGGRGLDAPRCRPLTGHRESTSSARRATANLDGLARYYVAALNRLIAMIAVCVTQTTCRVTSGTQRVRAWAIPSRLSEPFGSSRGP